MGFLAKSATKKRIAPMVGPVNEALTGTPWLISGAIPTAALVRSAVLALDLTGVRTSSLRGRVSRFSATHEAHLWVESDDFKTWTFVLGISNGAGGIAADWAVKAAVNSDKSVSVTTSHYLTKDDVLVHGDQHDALRQELLRALALGEVTDPLGEAEVTASSLAIPQVFSEAGPGVKEMNFRFTTSLGNDEIGELLPYVGARVTRRSQERISWGLGLPRHDAHDFATATLTPGQIVVAAHVGSETFVSRRMAMSDLHQLVARIARVIRSKDEDAAYDGPPELAP